MSGQQQQRQELFGANLPAATTEAIGATPPIDLPCKLLPRVYDEAGAYYEHRIVDARGNTICMFECPDGAEDDAAHQRAICKAYWVLDAINAKAAP